MKKKFSCRYQTIDSTKDSGAPSISWIRTKEKWKKKLKSEVEIILRNVLNAIVIWFDPIDSFVSNRMNFNDFKRIIHRNSFSLNLDSFLARNYLWSQWGEARWGQATGICRNRCQSNFSFIVLLIIFICNRMNFSFSSVIDKTFDEFIHGFFLSVCVCVFLCKRSKSYPWIMDWVYWGYLKQNWTMAS